MLSATRPVGVSVWVGKKQHPKIATYEKQKTLKSYDFGDFWYAVRDSNCGAIVFSNFFRTILCQTV